MIEIDADLFVSHGCLSGLIETINVDWETVIAMRQQLYAQMLGWA